MLGIGPVGERIKENWKGLWTNPASFVYYFCSQFIIWNFNTWPTLTALDAGNCSPAVVPEGKGSICHRPLPEFSSTCQPGYCHCHLVAKLFLTLFATAWAVAHQPSLPMGYLRQEYRDQTRVSCIADRRFLSRGGLKSQGIAEPLDKGVMSLSNYMK